MAYTYTELENMIIEDLRENLDVSPHEVADILDYLANLTKDADIITTYGGLLNTTSSDPSVSGHEMFGIATEQGTYENLTGNPQLTEAFGLFHFDGTAWSNATNGLVGEKNVQSDYNETDSNSDAFIKNKFLPDTGSFTGADLTDNKKTLPHTQGREVVILVLIKDGEMVAPGKFIYKTYGSTQQIELIVQLYYQTTTIFQYLIL